MNVLVLSRQKPENAPFATWLPEVAANARLFTATERAAGFPEFASVQAFDDYETTALVELEALRLHRTWPIDRIVATSEADILRAGRLRTALGLPGQSAASALAFRDKIVMKERLANAVTQVRLPTFKQLEDALDLITFVEANGLPVIVKPVDGSGSVGTTVLRTDEDLKALLRNGLPRGLEVETFITGAMYHVDGLVLDGELVLCWPSKYLGDCLSYAQGGISASTMLAPADPLTARLQAAAREILAILPTPPSTSFHLELFRTPDDELYFCEIASRTGGALINPMLEKAFGINLNQVFVRAQAGLPVDVAALKAKAAAPARLLGLGLLPPKAGVFAGYKTAAPSMPWVELFAWTLAPGSASSGAQLSVDHAATFIIEHDGGPEAEARLIETWRWANEHADWR